MSKRSHKRATTGDYEVEDIYDHRINPETLQTEFRVKWKGYSKKESTWEPIDHVYKCPIIINNFIEKKKKALDRRLKDLIPKEMTVNLSAFKPLKEDITRKFTDPEETVPVGKEELVCVQNEHMSLQGNFLWRVVFAHDGLPCLVRKSVICYYWPFHACMQLHRLVEFAAKSARLEEKK